MLSKEFEKIAGSEIQKYLFEQSDYDVRGLQLRHSEMFGLPFRLIAEQLKARQKAKAKLPLLYETKGILYPPSVNVEQCSSDVTGNFKVELCSRVLGKGQFKAADLTGGLGIDSFYFSNKAALVDYVEPDLNLLQIAQHNHRLLGRGNIKYHAGTAEEFLAQCGVFYDLIYADPSRRDETAKKIFRLSDCRPDVRRLLPQIFNFTEFVMVKASPLLDIQQGLNELAGVRKVIVVAVRNECKEILFLMQKGFSGKPTIEAFGLDKLGEEKHYFAFTLEEEKNAESNFDEPNAYLYEPDGAIIKAGAFKLIGQKFGLQKLHANTHFYTSNLLKKKFPGRIFSVVEPEFEPRRFTDRKANIITRNYPLSADQLRKKLKLADGGESYVIAFSGLRRKYVVLARRLA